MKTEKHGDSKAFISFTLDNTIKHCMAVIWCARLKLALMQVDSKCKFLSRVVGIVLQGRGGLSHALHLSSRALKYTCK